MSSHLSAPVEDLVVVTLSDSVDIAAGSRALYLPVAGTVKVTTKNGNARTLALGAGWHPMSVTRVWLTGTTASLAVYAGY